MKSRSKVIVALALLLAFRLSAANDSDAQFKRISQKLVCQCGCNYLLSDCPHLECPSAIPMRKQIRAYLAQGMSEQAVIEAMVKEHGMVVLAAPPAKGFNLAAWVMPFVALALGFFIVRRVLLRMRARAQTRSEAAAPDASLQAYEERLAEEIRALEEETAAKKDSKP